MDFLALLALCVYDSPIMREKHKMQKPPYETAADRWNIYTRPYGAAVHLAMNVEERARWMKTPGLSDLRIFSCGCYARAWGHAWKRKNLAEGVYLYCVAGKGYYRYGGREWTISPGDLLYCPPNTQHEYRADLEDPWTIYWLHVSGSRRTLFERQLRLTRHAPTAFLGVNPELVTLFKRLFSFFQTAHEEPHLLAIQSCASDILGTMAVLAHTHQSRLHYSAEIYAVIRFMETSLSEPYGITDFARHANLSPYHFCRLFKRATGLSPVKYFNLLKIKKACSLLAGTRLRIKEIALRLGFKDQCYFSRAFKKVMGYSPEKAQPSFSESTTEPIL